MHARAAPLSTQWAAGGAGAAPQRVRCRAAARPRVQCRVAAASDLSDFEDFVLGWQTKLCDTFERCDGTGQKFCRDRWERGEGQGYGITRVMEGGAVLEKAAANVSVVQGLLSRQRAAAMSSRGRAVDPAGGQEYAAVALSLVFHSATPMLPTFRADVRCFQVEGVGKWYGGGADLTPFYLFDQDAKEFHEHWHRVCAPHGPGLYAAYKAWCDDYFKIPARGEHRGVGGLFFDDLPAGGPASGAEALPFPVPADAEAFTRAVCEGFSDSYLPIIERRREMPYTEAQRRWQLLRRGRYLEFNLLYDRGVKFGVDGGRFESVMVSAPPLIRWDYNITPEPGSEEERLVAVLRKPREWVAAPPPSA